MNFLKRCYQGLKTFKIFSKTTNRGLQFTREGFWFTLATTLFGVGAVNTGANTLYLALCLGICLMIFSGWLSEQIMRHTQIELIPGALGFAGESFTLEASIRNHHPYLSTIGLELRNHQLGIQRNIPLVPAQSEIQVILQGDNLPRGFYPTLNLECRTAFPFGLFVKFRFFELPAELHIAPGLISTQAETEWNPGSRQGKKDSVPGNEEFFQLKPYRFGDPVHLIHWKRSASISEVVLSQYTNPQDTQTVHYLMDFRHIDDQTVYEHYLSWCLSLLNQLKLKGIGWTVRIGRDRVLYKISTLARWMSQLPPFAEQNQTEPDETITAEPAMVSLSRMYLKNAHDPQ